MNRRGFLKGLAGAVGAAIILPPTVADAAEMGRRIWALGGIPEAQSYPTAQKIGQINDMTIRAAWAEMGFRVGDVVSITGPTSFVFERPNLYTLNRIEHDGISAHSHLVLQELS